MTTSLRGYHCIISAATGRVDPKELSAIEECMRHDVFHSTLDWQTREVLIAGAQAAEQALMEIGEISRAVVLAPAPLTFPR